jgi:hypothetical protein
MRRLEFVDAQDFSDSRRLTRELLGRLDREGLFTEAAEDRHVDTLFNTWQMPMYNLEFTLVHVPLEELRRQRDNLFYAEVGSDYY